MATLICKKCPLVWLTNDGDSTECPVCASRAANALLVSETNKLLVAAEKTQRVVEAAVAWSKVRFAGQEHVVERQVLGAAVDEYVAATSEDPVGVDGPDSGGQFMVYGPGDGFYVDEKQLQVLAVDIRRALARANTGCEPTLVRCSGSCPGCGVAFKCMGNATATRKCPCGTEHSLSSFVVPTPPREEPMICNHQQLARVCLLCEHETTIADLQTKLIDVEKERDGLRELQAIVNRDGGQKGLEEAKQAAWGYLSRITELENILSGLADVWKEQGDKAIPEDVGIELTHPVRSGRHDLYQEAMRLVSAKHSKYGIIGIVNWLLHRLSAAEETMKKLERIREAAYIYAKPGADFAAPEEMKRRRDELVEALMAMRSPASSGTLGG